MSKSKEKQEEGLKSLVVPVLVSVGLITALAFALKNSPFYLDIQKERY